MKKILKNICACLVMLVIFAGSFALVGCGADDEEKLMAVSMNPALEFVLDEDDKVVSVTATNDDGNFILTKVDFEGKTAREAVNEFLRVAKENGFVIAGEVDATENQLTISISGDDAEKLFNQVKKSANSYLNDLGVSVQVNFGEVISKEDLQNKVKEMMQELSATEVAQMSEEELLELIEETHNETKELLTQELKELYYKTRAEEIVKAKFEAVKQLLTQNSALLQTQLDTITQSLADMSSNITAVKDSFKANVLSGAYAVEMQNYVSAKKALLEEQLKETVDEGTISNLEDVVVTAKANLASAKAQAELLMAQANAVIDTAISQMNTALNGVLTIMSTFIQNAGDTIEDAIENVENTYKTTFETEFSSYIADAETLWASMQPNTPAVA